MKGLILSIAVFAAYVIGSMIVSHIRKPAFISRIFLPGLAIATVLYFIAFALTPPDLGFLSPSWMARPAALDAAYGCVVLWLNAHSFIDFFFGFNGGFSMSVMLEILRRLPRGATADELVKCYMRPDGFDKIYSWRLPRLAGSGMIVIDKQEGTCAITQSGKRAALIGVFCKRLLNLGAGG